MGKRTIIDCDLCHAETADEELTSFIFKSPGKQKGRSYEVCKACASKVETQLVSNNQLSSGWGFGNSSATSKPDESVSERRARLANIEPSDDDAFVKEKTQELEALEERGQERIGTGPKTVQAKGKDDKCLHYNKTPPMLGNIDGKKGFVQRCKECRELIPVRSADERHSVSNIQQGDK